MLSSSASSSSPLQRPRVSVLSPPAQSSHSSPASVEHSDPSKQRESSSQPRESSQTPSKVSSHFLIHFLSTQMMPNGFFVGFGVGSFVSMTSWGLAVRYGGDFVCVGRPVSAACGALIFIEGFDADHRVSRPIKSGTHRQNRIVSWKAGSATHWNRRNRSPGPAKSTALPPQASVGTKKPERRAFRPNRTEAQTKRER